MLCDIIFTHSKKRIINMISTISNHEKSLANFDIFEDNKKIRSRVQNTLRFVFLLITLSCLAIHHFIGQEVDTNLLIAIAFFSPFMLYSIFEILCGFFEKKHHHTISFINETEFLKNEKIIKYFQFIPFILLGAALIIISFSTIQL